MVKTVALQPIFVLGAVDDASVFIRSIFACSCVFTGTQEEIFPVLLMWLETIDVLVY